jgi:hypothetical protein
MTAFLNSIKADLLDVRLRLAVLLLAIGLLAAVAYAVLGGSTSSPTAPSSRTPGATPGIAVSLAPANPAAPVAETSNGSSQQRHGIIHNPFSPLPGSAVSATSAKASTPSTPASPTTTAKTGSSAQGTGVTTPAAPAKPPKPSKPSKPAKPKTPAIVYHVAVLFGQAPPGTPPQSLQLTPYENLGPNQPLPSSTQPLLVFRGVAAGGASATFTLIGEAILHGNATCTPSPSQCQSIGLTVGQTEELEYLQASGQALTYQLQLVSITHL